MDGYGVKKVKNYLEELYDIPFDVEDHSLSNDMNVDICPHNRNNELFCINIRIKNRLRLILEVNPQKYSAFSILDMGNASLEKKSVFAEFAKQIKDKKAKTDFTINGTGCEMMEPVTWPDDWKSYHLRITRSPITEEDEAYNEADIVAEWAAITTGMFLSLLDIETDDEQLRSEGGLTKAETNRYERNPINRQLCLAANGYTCKICGFNFENTYGDIGYRFIHVHHIVPVSYSDTAYKINPVHDMIPVCPNCHAMLHRKDPPFLPAELQHMLNENRE